MGHECLSSAGCKYSAVAAGSEQEAAGMKIELLKSEAAALARFIVERAIVLHSMVMRANDWIRLRWKICGRSIRKKWHELPTKNRCCSGLKMISIAIASNSRRKRLILPMCC